MADLQWWVSYEYEINKLVVMLMGPEKEYGISSENRPKYRNVVAKAEIPVDAPEILLDKEVERVKAELLRRHRTATALVERHNGKSVDTADPS